MAKAVRYYTYRDGPDTGVRIWETAAGAHLSPADARAYAQEQAGIHGFTYQIVLSAEAGLDLGSAGYRQFLDAEGFKDYLLIQHHNTDNAHAHVIAWRSQVISKKEIGGFLERYDQVAVALKEAQRAQSQERERGTGPTAADHAAADLLTIVAQPTADAAWPTLTDLVRSTPTSDTQAEAEALDAWIQQTAEPDAGDDALLTAVQDAGETRQVLATVTAELREPPSRSVEEEEAFLAFLAQLDAELQAEAEHDVEYF